MKNYWSCSKFADWLRGTPNLEHGTSEEWAAWRKSAKRKQFRYWLAEEGLDYLQNIICAPITFLNAIIRYIRHRFVAKTHTLTSNLKRGTWHEWDDRILHCLFDELVNFVEIEFGYQHRLCSEEDRKKYQIPWYRKSLKLGLWRCPEAGLDYLNWASALKYEEDELPKNDPKLGKPTSQALAAQEILVLYCWWTIERPKRPNPDDVSGYSAYYNEKKNNSDNPDDPLDFLISNKRSEKEIARTRALLDACSKIEEDYDSEDTEMLIRLMKIRHFLWT